MATSPNNNKVVDFTPSNFTARDIRYEIPALLTNNSVTVLHLPMDRLDDACTKCIVMMLEKDDLGPQIEELHLSHTQSDEENSCNSKYDEEAPFAQIMSSLKHGSVLKKLAISETALMGNEITAISSMLYDIKNLNILSLRHCNIDHKAATKISCALTSNQSVESLDFSNNPLGNRGVSGLCVALEINTTIKKVKLSGTNLGIEGAVALATVITSNSSLAVLDLSRNPIGDMGLSKLAIALRKNKSIRQLSLRQTSMSDVGALCILLSLYDSKSLQAILHCNHTIRYLNLDNNEISRKILLDIEKAQRMNLRQTEIETIRQKVAFFLNDESNSAYFGEDTTVNCIPYMLSAIGHTESLTALFNLVKNVHVPALFETTPMVTTPDSLFSNENNDADNDKNDGSVPAFIQVKACQRPSSSLL